MGRKRPEEQARDDLLTFGVAYAVYEGGKMRVVKADDVLKEPIRGTGKPHIGFSIVRSKHG